MLPLDLSDSRHEADIAAGRNSPLTPSRRQARVRQDAAEHRLGLAEANRAKAAARAAARTSKTHGGGGDDDSDSGAESGEEGPSAHTPPSHELPHGGRSHHAGAPGPGSRSASPAQSRAGRTHALSEDGDGGEQRPSAVRLPEVEPTIYIGYPAAWRHERIAGRAALLRISGELAQSRALEQFRAGRAAALQQREAERAERGGSYWQSSIGSEDGAAAAAAAAAQLAPMARTPSPAPGLGLGLVSPALQPELRALENILRRPLAPGVARVPGGPAGT